MKTKQEATLAGNKLLASAMKKGLAGFKIRVWENGGEWYYCLRCKYGSIYPSGKSGYYFSLINDAGTSESYGIPDWTGGHSRSPIEALRSAVNKARKDVNKKEKAVTYLEICIGE